MGKDKESKEMYQYLKSYRILVREAKRLEAHAYELDRMSRQPVIRWGGKDGPSQAYIERLKATAAERMEEALRQCQEIEALISAVQGKGVKETLQYRQLLWLKHIEGLTFKEIAKRLFFSERHVRRLHDEALKAAAAVDRKEREHD